jgi:general secretion pathway protein G
MKTQKNAAAGYFNRCAGNMPVKDTPKQFGLPLNNLGFTLVELIVVCAVLGVLATVAMPAYQDLTNKAIIGKAKTEIRVIEKAINAYAIDRNRLPDQLSDIGAEANFLDPWKRNYQYYNIGSASGTQYTCYDPVDQDLNDDFDLYSLGKDGATDHDITDPGTDPPNQSSDDIVRARNGSTVELGSQF